MTNSKQSIGGQDRKPIGLSEDYEVRDWSKSLVVTADQCAMPSRLLETKRTRCASTSPLRAKRSATAERTARSGLPEM